PARDRPAVEALPAYELRLRERGGVEAARLALRPSLDRALGDVERVDVRGNARGGEGEGHFAAVRAPFDTADDSRAQAELGRRLLARGQVGHPRTALACGDGLAHEELRVVRAPVEGDPAPAFEGQEEPIRLGIARIHHVDVAVLAVAARGRVGDAVALAGPAH